MATTTALVFLFAIIATASVSSGKAINKASGEGVENGQVKNNPVNAQSHTVEMDVSHLTNVILAELRKEEEANATLYKGHPEVVSANLEMEDKLGEKNKQERKMQKKQEQKKQKKQQQKKKQTKQQKKKQQQEKQKQKKKHNEEKKEDKAVEIDCGDSGACKPKSLILHIPKSAGTSLCRQFKTDGRNVSGSQKVDSWMACFDRQDGPEWCCVKHSQLREKSCEQRRAAPEITMIEKYMDTDKATNTTLFCDGVEYGILFREPVGRALSHVHHYFQSRSKPMKAYIASLVALGSASKLMDLIENIEGLDVGGSDVAGAIADGLDGLVDGLGYQWAHIEEDLRKLSAFTSNYAVRMLLGAQLGPEPLKVKRSVMQADGGLYDKALTTLKKFDWVLRLEDSGTELGLAIESKFLGIDHISHDARVADHDDLHALLHTAQFKDWVTDRLDLDTALYSACNPPQPADQAKGEEPVYNCYN